MSSFFLFFYKKELKELLLAELAYKCPELKLSFSNKDFISMKGTVSNQELIQETPVYFCTKVAVFIDKKINPPSPSENFIQVKHSEWWLYEPLSRIIPDQDQVSIKVPEKAPARAYLKMKEAKEAFHLNIKKNQTIIEIGSAPGGISYYLLELGAKLIAIDPALMDKELQKNYPKHLKHLKVSIFDVKKDHLPKKCDWIISDLNLPGDLNINQSVKIMNLYPQLKGAFLTVKTPDFKEVRKIKDWIKLIPNKFDVTVVNLPSHKKEVGFIITKDEGELSGIL